MTLFIASIVIALTVSFLCSIMEAALLSLTPSKLALISERSPVIGRICAHFKKDIEKPIAVILILNTAAHTFGASIAGAEFDELFGNRYIWIFSLAFTVMMVQYTEILPKTLGVRFNLPVMAYTARTLKFLVWLMSPLIALVHLINRPFDPHKNERKEEKINIGEITALATMAREAEQITTTQEQIIRNTPMLGKRTIEELMLPLEKVCMIPESASRLEIMNLMRKDQHSRYP
ncbi:MAG: CNNM domain-containing protein [Victivallales bacterium]